MTDQVDIFPKRTIGSLTIDVVIEEDHVDDLTITDHPVEQGATISDHAYQMPAQLTMRAGWSNSSDQAGGDNTYIETIYQQLRQLQYSRELLTVVTGKRTYQNMLIRSLSTTTDNETPSALVVNIMMREVIVADTQIVTSTPSSSQKNPSSTSAISQEGTKQANQVQTPTAADLGE